MIRVRKPNGKVTTVSRGWWKSRKGRSQYRNWTEYHDDGPFSPPQVEAKAETPRIVHVIPWDLTVGGIQTMVSMWCERCGGGLDVHVVSPGRRGELPFTGATVHAGVEGSAALKFLAALKPDVLVHHGPTNHYGRFNGCPVVWVVHSQLVFGEVWPKWCKPRAILSNFPPSPADCGPGWDDAEITALPLGVDTAAFRTKPLIAAISGRLSPEKVPREFVETLAAWDNPHGWQIWILGTGIENRHQAWVRQRLAGVSWVRFFDDTPHDQMPELLWRVDALLAPSLWESGSYAILEAMACGLPVVARHTGGVPFNTNGGAWLVKEDSEFLDALNALSSPILRRMMSERARQEAEGRHRLEAHVTAHTRTFLTAMGALDGLPDVDVLMPVYNTPGEWLREAWRSIRNQMHRPRRSVIVDDGSTRADTLEALLEIADDETVELVRLDTNGGVANALNIGLRHCRADLVARMDADDIADTRRLELQARYMREHPDVTVCGAQVQASDGRKPTEHPAVVTPEIAERSNWFLNHPTAVFRRAAVRDAGGYPDYPASQDIALWLRLIRRDGVIHNLPDVLLTYRVHPGQATARHNTAEIVARIRRDMES